MARDNVPKELRTPASPQKSLTPEERTDLEHELDEFDRLLGIDPKTDLDIAKTMAELEKMLRE